MCRLLPGERLDDLQRCGYYIIQNPERFCFGIDAVLLSGFAKAEEGESVLDLGTGTGIIPILMEAKTQGRHFTGLEILPEIADMASRSVEYDHLEDKIDIVTGDIKEASAIFGKASFDVVTANPPYMNDGAGKKNRDFSKAVAKHEILCRLEDVVREAGSVLKDGGRFYMIHRPNRLPEIFELTGIYRLRPVRMRLVYPGAGKDANMVLFEAVKGGRGHAPFTVEKPLTVYESPGVYSQEIYEIYGMTGGDMP